MGHPSAKDARLVAADDETGAVVQRVLYEVVSIMVDAGEGEVGASLLAQARVVVDPGDLDIGATQLAMQA